MILPVTDTITLELLTDAHSAPLFAVVDANRDHLRTWLPWVDHAHSAEFIQNFIKGSQQRTKEDTEYAFVIKEGNEIIGRIGVYKIDKQNRIGEIGYWISRQEEGKGIVTRCCERLMQYCFQELQLHRIELKCGTENKKSQTIPHRLGFTQEGILRQAELIRDTYIDLVLYSKLRTE